MFKCSCGFVSPFYQVVCKNCRESGKMEEIPENVVNSTGKRVKINNLPKKFKYKDTKFDKEERLFFENSSLNELFGGGLTKGSINFFTAEPGAGKSTFLGQLGLFLKDKTLKILYYSAEENTSQVWKRLERLYNKDNLLLNNISLYYGRNSEELIGLIDREKPDIVIVDSINGLAGESYVNQVNVLNDITNHLKKNSITGFVVGHINKTGEIAGKKTLEHIVDGIFMITGKDDRTDKIRILKVIKLRFGQVDNIVLLEMNKNGFTIQDPKDAFKLFIKESSDKAGSVYCPVLEGNQLLLIEIQSLLEDAVYSYPQKVGLGINKQKLDILLATIQKSLKLSDLKEKDVFIKILSPFEFKNVNLDLATVCSILSSFFNVNFKQYVFVGELGLAGEIRSVPKQQEIENRLLKMGIKKENIISRKTCPDLALLLKNILLKNNIKK